MDVKAADPEVEFADVTAEGVYFNGAYLCKAEEHDQAVKIALRNPKPDFAVFNHTKDDIFDYGSYHRGADVVILDDPYYAEKILACEVLPDGYVMQDGVVTLHQGEEERERYTVGSEALRLLLKDLLEKYE